MRATVDADWLIQLRWWILAALVVVVLNGEPGVPAYGLLATFALSNAVLMGVRSRLADPRAVGGVLVLDVALLTALLHVTGGPMNPFTALYFVSITMAAVLLSPRWIAALLVASLLGYGSLFLLDDGHAHNHGGMQAHLRGMWVAFGVVALLVALFVTRLRRQIAARDEELAETKEREARSRRVAALTSLAAGATHELGTPVGTIALAAGELEEALRDAPDEVRADVQLIREEVARCRAILGQLSTVAGELPGEATREVTLGEIVDGAVARLPEARIEANVARASVLHLPPAALELALRNLLQNALDAGEGSVELAGDVTGDAVRFEVRDHGRGMSEETLRRATEPFFSTKEEHHGMGLGLYLVNALAEQLGGRLELTSGEGEGTTASLSLPRSLEGAT